MKMPNADAASPDIRFLPSNASPSTTLISRSAKLTLLFLAGFVVAHLGMLRSAARATTQVGISDLTLTGSNITSVTVNGTAYSTNTFATFDGGDIDLPTLGFGVDRIRRSGGSNPATDAALSAYTGDQDVQTGFQQLSGLTKDYLFSSSFTSSEAVDVVVVGRRQSLFGPGGGTFRVTALDGGGSPIASTTTIEIDAIDASGAGSLGANLGAQTYVTVNSVGPPTYGGSGSFNFGPLGAVAINFDAGQTVGGIRVESSAGNTFIDDVVAVSSTTTAFNTNNVVGTAGPGNVVVNTSGDTAVPLSVVDLTNPLSLEAGDYRATQFSYEFLAAGGEAGGTVQPFLATGSGTSYTVIALGEPFDYSGATVTTDPFGGQLSAAFTLAGTTDVFAGFFWEGSARSGIGYINGAGSSFLRYSGGSTPLLGDVLTGGTANTFSRTYDFSITVENLVVPEPSTLALTALGLLSLGCAGWRRRRRA